MLAIAHYVNVCRTTVSTAINPPLILCVWGSPARISVCQILSPPPPNKRPLHVSDSSLFPPSIAVNMLYGQSEFIYGEVAEIDTDQKSIQWKAISYIIYMAARSTICPVGKGAHCHSAKSFIMSIKVDIRN